MRETLLSRLLARPVTVLVLLATLLVVGGIANARIPRQLVPGGIVSPVVSVMIPVPESTPREVMERVVKVQANKVIALDLGVSQRTVEIHRARVMQKMSARSLAELVTLAGKLSA